MEPAFVLGQAYPNNIREAIEDQEVQGTGYELEFEDEYDSGTVARSETLFVGDLLVQSIGRVLMIALCASRRVLPLADPQIAFVPESYSSSNSPSYSVPYSPIA
jgi:hypothetical protein